SNQTRNKTRPKNRDKTRDKTRDQRQDQRPEVIANDRAHKRRQDELKASRRDCLDLEASVLRFRAQKRLLFSSSRPLMSPPFCVAPSSPSANSVAPGGLSVDSISDLVESQSRLLEALQLSHPAELDLKKPQGSSRGRTPSKLSLNPIYRQVPRLVESCCHCIESHGLQTVGIFRVGSSKKRVRQVRALFSFLALCKTKVAEVKGHLDTFVMH
uniref:Rho-GAP domain-containing protein n=1 Tax=Periophthalmus magnuspinnatus TaxID=409849 RepID=A0A3B4AJZ8_9GOBI